jgi:hypothetical protein
MTDKRIAEDGETVAAEVAITDQSGRVAFTEVIDATGLTGVKRHKDGYIAGRVKAARTGVQVYTGAEMGIPDMETVAVYRPVEEVMRIDALGSFKGKPITDGHPSERVTADNWQAFARGTVMGVQRQGDAVALDITISDASLVGKLESGAARELSAGYVANIDRTSGVAPDGTAYDAIQRDIYVDHLAIVPKGRAGSEFRVGDGANSWGARPITKSSQKETKMSDAQSTVVLGDEAVQVSAADAAKITAFKDAQAKALTDAQAAHDDALASKDAEIDKLKGQLDAANEKVLSDDALDQRVADRADLIGKANAIAKDVATKGLSDAAIRKAVVAAKLGDAAISGKSDAYIEARFDVLAEDAAKGDPVADALKSGAQTGDMTVSDKAYADNLTYLQSAYRGDAAQKEA